MKNKMFVLSLIPMILICFFIINISAEDEQIKKTTNTALLLIDIQEFYFPGGSLPLYKSKEASLNAKKILKKFRKTGQLIIHIKHAAQKGADIHSSVKPQGSEKIIEKKEVNCFLKTSLLSHLRKHLVTDLVLVGMQTHMCLEAAARAAKDYGFKCIIIEDACATRNLKFKNLVIKAADVHASTLATLKAYAKITDTQTFLN